MIDWLFGCLMDWLGFGRMFIGRFYVKLGEKVYYLGGIINLVGVCVLYCVIDFLILLGKNLWYWICEWEGFGDLIGDWKVVIVIW